MPVSTTFGLVVAALFLIDTLRIVKSMRAHGVSEWEAVRVSFTDPSPNRYAFLVDVWLAILAVEVALYFVAEVSSVVFSC